jgi:hypothetical protein
MADIILLVKSTTGVIPNKSHESLKLLLLRPGLYILMHQAVKIHTI